MARLLARIRIPLLSVTILVVLFAPVPWWVGVPAIGVAMALYGWVGRVRAEPVTVAPPVRGAWRAVNSPSSRVPSHGIHTYGQTYAIDLVLGCSDKSGFVRPEEFPGFGQPIVAAAGGRVVRVRQGQRDHRSRNSPAALLYLLVEGMLRELLGAGRVIGNHVVIDLGDRRYALYAHLRRGSVTVQPGDRVEAGQEIARCGNSGNSSEPHLHFQVMDLPWPSFAAGLPFRFGANEPPRNGELLRVTTVEPSGSRTL